ncbi:excinuclease ABC subunit UvrC [Desulfurivibrio alkaliphilus]|uniref:UvrABC system protein C n=1 Tax=Desulfurivibrio alkaliphilus (strain DSM 19089 / UNIQEM U267 / AHT2) TaxID=589865 RepID=D6Z1Y0_DESAT|nr:excinuclease ABC subunit UvrC [Desulfurivibrio alkaliphilus]ADH85555.1 excinuclease ABC, C subunit [Desulfurivibrio alkaliphilus AHT 2]
MFDPVMIADAADAPGVYLMRDAGGQVLYVGKAVSLRKRLQSYSRIDPAGRSKTSVMLGKVAKVDTVLTRTEKEALILEAGLIKQHRPRYNVILRDDKSYPHLKVTVQEEWPRLLMTRRVSKDGARYFGPYASPAAMWETLRLLNSLFPLRRCKAKKFAPGQRACLNHQMGRCPAPCIGAITPEAYRQRVSQVLAILEGRKRELTRELTGRMQEAAAGLNFEEAAALRDQIRALNQTLEKQVVLGRERVDLDVFGLVRRHGQVAAALLFIREGALADKREFFLAEPVGEDDEVLAELLRRFYEHPQRPIPRSILLPLPAEGAAALTEWLSEKRGGPVRLLVPRRGDKKALVTMAGDNAGQLLAAREKQQAGWLSLGEEIRRALRLTSSPQRIECLDISNLGGREAVGSLVSFRQGEKESSRYRRFHIRNLATPDDYAMMREVLLRHLCRAAAAETLPDLLVLDGGKGQLGVAQAVLAELALPGPELVSIAKDREGSGERLFRPGRKNHLKLAQHSPVLLFFMKIRDEAHRFGITFHRRLRRQKQLVSRLEEIPGVGPGRKQALLKQLGSLAGVAAATPEQLAAVPGIGPELAAVIHRHLQLPRDGETPAAN